MSEQERRKWDAYYDSLPLNEEDESTRLFNAEFVEQVSALLPQGSATLEAGCGAGWQSLALARSGRFEVNLMDFSPRALDYSRRVFAREGVAATFLQGDINESGSPGFDLVFNAGVLEHYTFEEQSALLRAMASRSRRYVLVLVPNALCYWYWLWRIDKMARADWPFGTEVPLADLAALFRSAGLQFCGQVFLGRSWSEAFIRGVPGMDPVLTEKLLEIHRQQVVPLAQRSYLVAALGSVSADDPVPAGWTFAAAETMETAEQRALMADGLSLRIGGGSQLIAERRQFETTLAAEREKWSSTLEIERSRARSAQQKLESVLASELARSESALLAELDRLESARTAELERLESLRRRVLDGLRGFRLQFEKQLAAYKTQRAWQVMLALRKAYTVLARRKVRGLLPLSNLQEFDLVFPDVLDYVPHELDSPGSSAFIPPRANRKYDVVVLPIFDFEFRFQRPQQIAVQFAQAGHRVFWISPSRLLPVASQAPYETVPIRENLWEVRLPADPFDLYRGELEPFQITALLDGLGRLYRDLDIAASCTILQFPFWRRIGLGLRQRLGAKVVYDCMDDWQNWPVEPLPGAFSLSEERELVRESDVLVVTSRELHDRHAADGVVSRFIPNAADFEFFHNAPESGLARPERPSDQAVIGYYGAIADWFDLELMTKVARSRPQYSFVLIGQVHMLDVSALAALPNVRLLGEKHYRELPGYLREFDVCTLPFRMNRLTKAVDPVKMYEYFSQGKPVVSAPLPELAPLAELLYFARGPEEFAKQIDAAVAEKDASLAQKRIAFASENTWRRRYDTLDSAICALYPLVSILIVTYNTREYLGPCLDSIRRNATYPSYEVIVVDNCSTDGSAEDLARYAAVDPRVRVECLKTNLGFAGGNNYAAGLAKGDYLVLLNPDTIVTAGWLERLLRPLEKDAGVGMAAPVSNFSGNETKVNTHYRTLQQMEGFAAEQAKFKNGKTFDIEVIPLFCALLRRKTWDEAGGLDDGFQVGTFEDDDFSLRLRKLGYRIVAAEDCFIHHFGNGSFGKLHSEEVHRIFEINQKRFESKWNAAWRGHKTRPGVRPVSTANRIPIAEFFKDDGEP